MKKILISLILIFTLLFSLTACSLEDLDFAKNEKYKNALALIEEGKLEEAKSIFEELEDYKDSETLLGRFYYIPYDIVGEEENEVFRFKISFNSDILPDKIEFYDDGEKDTIAYSYDTDGILIKEIETDEDGDKYITDYAYDANNNLIKEVYTNYDGNKSITDYAYDANNNLIKEVYTSYNGNKSITDCTYDTNNNLIKEVYTYPAGHKDVTDYTYDANNNLIKKVYTHPYGDKEILDFTYDENGNLSKAVLKSDGENGSMEFAYKLIFIPFEVNGETKTLLDILCDPVSFMGG